MKNAILFVLLFCASVTVSAQDADGKREIEAYKVKYLTERLELSPSEAKVFWPIYNSWQAEQAALRKERAQKMISSRTTSEIENLSDQQVQALITNEINIKQRALNIEKKYYNQLKSSLPIKTVGKYYRAQETFKKELLDRYRGRRSNKTKS